MKKIIVLLLLTFNSMYANTSNACDTLAAHPDNKLNPSGVKGVEYMKLDVDKAIEACTKAIKDFPDELRYSYQLGRAYYKSKNYQKAFEWYKKAALKDYAQAQDALAEMYSFGQNDKNFKEPEDEWYPEKGTQEAYDESLKWYLKAANNGNSSAQNSVASRYYYAKGVKKDYKKAFMWYMEAAEQGSASGQINVGGMYYEGEFVDKDYEKALKWYMKASDNNSSYAQKLIGEMYQHGKGVKKDINSAIAWHTKSANLNGFSSQIHLGDMYYKGEDVEQNYDEAMNWYMKAAENNETVILNIPQAQVKIANMYYDGIGVKKDYKEAFKWLMKAAELGDAKAQYRIGWMYHFGVGVKKDYKKDYKWFLKAAEQGNANAQFIIGRSYYLGNNVKKDYKQASKWYLKAAEQGNANAQYDLGEMYCDGQGVKKDCKEAFKWYMKAAEQDDIDAIEQVAMRYWFGYAPDGDQRSRKKAFKWYMRAAKLNSAYAQNQVADAYYEGDGTRKNYKQAFKWHLKAAKQDNYLSQMDIGKMYANGLGTDVNYVQAYAWLSIALTNFPKVDYIDNYLEGQRTEIEKYLNKLESKLSHKQITIAQNYDPRQSDNIPKSNSKNKLSKNRTGIGTGFFINTSNVVTNHHVVEECSSIELVRGESRADAKIVVDDSRNDLAVLKTDKTNDKYLKLRAGKSIRIGEEIIVLGYPLGILLGSGIKLTTGDVSSLTGLVDDSTNMQISAPVQPGNSGGPLLDKSGNVVGIIYSRVEKTLSGRSTQNVNLAIKSNILQMLLDTKNIEYDIALSKEKKEAADIADTAKESIVQIVCHK